MSTSETDSEPELEPAIDIVSSLTAFAHSSATRPSQVSAQETVSWAVDTLATLDFRLVRKDATLHELIQNCASTILASFNSVLRKEPVTGNACSLISDVASILRPSVLHLLFQYRRLFRVIATRNLKTNSAPLAIVCWVDVILAKLGDVVAFIAAGFDGPYPSESLTQSLKDQREEDNLRAAIQLPDNLDLLPSVLLSERVSAAGKRLSVKLMFGRYILCPALLGQVGTDNRNHVDFRSIHELLSTFAEFIRRSAARLDGLHSVSGLGLQYLVQQERFIVAMTISLFAIADVEQYSAKHTAPFRPQTMAAAMQLLRFVLKGGAQTSSLGPVEHLDIPAIVITRWRIVPQWTWSIWLEYRTLHADTIICLTTTYIQHYGSLPEDSVRCNIAAVMNVIIDVVFRFISVLSTGGHLSTSMINVLYESCRWISEWMHLNSCGIRNSEDCCKALIILFGHLSQDEQHFALNELIVSCLALVGEQCTREAWKAAVEDDKFHFIDALGQGAKMASSLHGISKSRETCVAQLMQFLVVMMSKGVEPLEPDAFAELIEAVGERLVDMPANERGMLCEMFLVCLATANVSNIELALDKESVAADEEAVWHLGMCNGDGNLCTASALARFMTSRTARMDPLTYLEGMEYLVDASLLGGELPVVVPGMTSVRKDMCDVTK